MRKTNDHHSKPAVTAGDAIQEENQYITIGKIGAAHGIRGWLKVFSYAEFNANIIDYQPWYFCDQQGRYNEIHIEASKLHGENMLVKLVGVHTPEDARLLTGNLVMIRRSQLPALKKNEYYWSDLIGLTVINQQGCIYGKVIYLIATGANDVLVVEDHDHKEHAIPYLFGETIKHIDLIKKEIRVDWELL